MDTLLQPALGLLVPSVLLSSPAILWLSFIIIIFMTYVIWAFLLRVDGDITFRSRSKSRLESLASSLSVQSYCNKWFKLSQYLSFGSVCSSKPNLEEEIEATVICISKEFIRPWCESLGIDDIDVSNEAERIVTHMFIRISYEFLAHVDVPETLPICVRELTSHLLKSNICDSVEALDKSQEVISQIFRDLIRRFGPDDLVRLAEVELPTVGRPTFSKKDALYLMIQELVIHAVMIPLVSLISSPEMINRSLMGLFLASRSAATSSSSTSSWNKSRKSLPLLDYPEAHLMKKSTSINFDDLSLTSSSMTRSQSLPPDALNVPIQETRSELYPIPRVEKGIDVAEDNRLFSNIKITETRIMGHRSDHYIAYKIVYDGLFEVLETIPSTRSTASCLVRQESFVWKRFSEFLTLHQKLEANPQLRLIIRSIEGPSKMKTVTSMLGSKVGRTVTEQRVKFLVMYLRQLISITPVCNSLEMRNFLEYDITRPEPPSPSLMSSLLLPLRLDKVITDGIKGAVSVIKNVLPLDSVQDGYFNIFASHSIRPEIKTRFGGESILTDCLLSFQNSKGLLQLIRAVSDADSSKGFDSLQSSLTNNDFQLLRTTRLSGTNSPGVEVAAQENSMEPLRQLEQTTKLSLSDALVEFADVTLFTRKSGGDVHRVSLSAFLIKLFLEEQLEKLCKDWINELCEEKTFVSILHSLHNRLWPEEKDVCSASDTTTLSDAEVVTVEDLKREMLLWVERQLPPPLLSLVDVRKIIDFLITGFQDHQRNQLFIYNLIRIIYNQVIARHPFNDH